MLVKDSTATGPLQELAIRVEDLVIPVRMSMIIMSMQMLESA